VPTGGAEGMSFEPAGTVTHTETNGSDAGYSSEVVVHTNLFGYSDLDTVILSAVIWDLDYSSADTFDVDVADYAPNWWGTQWVDPTFEKYYMYREVILSNETSVGIHDSGNITTLPIEFRLEQNYPNPFNPTTNIRFFLPATSDITIDIYNLLGSKVTTLYNGMQEAGSHTVVWDGTDKFGNGVASGIYFYQLATSSFNQTRKMMLLK
jgi:hypothetical protein